MYTFKSKKYIHIKSQHQHHCYWLRKSHKAATSAICFSLKDLRCLFLARIVLLFSGLLPINEQD